jgi:hypothetical protein
LWASPPALIFDPGELLLQSLNDSRRTGLLLNEKGQIVFGFLEGQLDIGDLLLLLLEVVFQVLELFVKCVEDGPLGLELRFGLLMRNLQRGTSAPSFAHWVTLGGALTCCEAMASFNAASSDLTLTEDAFASSTSAFAVSTSASSCSVMQIPSAGRRRYGHRVTHESRAQQFAPPFA